MNDDTIARAVDVAERLALAKAKRRTDPVEIERLELELQDRVDDLVWDARYPR